MGAADLWRETLGAPVPSAALPPLSFSLGGVVANVDIPVHIDANKLREGEAPLATAWLRMTVGSACREVRTSLGMGCRVRLSRTRGDGEVSVNWSLEELYRHLHTIRIQFDHEVENKLLVVWASLQDSERRAGRAIRENELGRFKKHSAAQEAIIFDTTSGETVWRHVELAVRDGRWEALRHECPFGAVPRAFDLASVPVTDIPLRAIQSLGDNWYRRRSFRAQGASFDEAYRVLNADWREQQRRHAEASFKMQDLKRQRLEHMDAEAASSSRGLPMALQNPPYKQVYHGTLLETGKGDFTFCGKLGK